MSTFRHRTIKYEPPSLVRLAGKAINVNLKRLEDSERLNVPNYFKRILREKYVEDRLYCTENLNSCDDTFYFANRINFDRPFVDVGADSYLAYRDWTIGRIPDFAWEKNRIVHAWYRFGVLSERDKLYIEDDERYCVYCATALVDERRSDDFTHIKNSIYSEVVLSKDLIDEIFDVSEHWCSGCVTRTLFYIEDAEESTFIDECAWFELF